MRLRLRRPRPPATPASDARQRRPPATLANDPASDHGRARGRARALPGCDRAVALPTASCRPARGPTSPYIHVHFNFYGLLSGWLKNSQVGNNSRVSSRRSGTRPVALHATSRGASRKRDVTSRQQPKKAALTHKSNTEHTVGSWLVACGGLGGHGLLYFTRRKGLLHNNNNNNNGVVGHGDQKFH